MGYLDNSGLSYLWGKIKTALGGKQDKESSVSVPGSGALSMSETLGSGPYTIEFTEEADPQDVSASEITYDNTESGMAATNTQKAIDELFQSVSEGKSVIAAAVTDKGVETAATDSFAAMARKIGEISGGELISGNINLSNDDTKISINEMIGYQNFSLIYTGTVTNYYISGNSGTQQWITSVLCINGTVNGSAATATGANRIGLIHGTPSYNPETGEITSWNLLGYVYFPAGEYQYVAWKS